MNSVVEQEPSEITLTFREQVDGRKVSRLPGGKIVLVHPRETSLVGDGDTWRVQLDHRATYALALPVAREKFGNDPLARALVSPVVATRWEAQAVPSAELPAVPQIETTAQPRLSAMPNDLSRLLRSTDRVAFYVDGANTDGASRLAGYFLDYKKVREVFVGGATFSAAHYYAADFTDSDPQQQRYLDFLSYAGYIVHKRRAKVVHHTETGDPITKANMDTDIVLDMVDTAANYDVAFLLSGDSDFERTVERLRNRGKRVYLVTSRRCCSRELAYVADKPIFFLEDLRGVLARENRGIA